MLKENEAMLDRSGVRHWHENGYYGQKVNIAVLDPFWSLYDWQRQQGKIELPFGEKPISSNAQEGHGGQCAAVIAEVAPQANLFLLPNTEEAFVWCLQNDIQILSCSYNGFALSAGLQKKLQESNVTVFASSGNRGNRTDGADKTYPACYDFSIAVGAMVYHESQDKISASSNGGEALDCLAYTDVKVPTDKGTTVEFGGTSCACPFAAGQLALVWHRLGINKWQQAKAFIAEHCRDYGAAGKDRQSGYGLLVLPEVKTLTKTIVLRLGSKTAQVDGETVRLDRAPEAQDGVTLVPIRFLAETLGFAVDYDSSTQTITVRGGKFS